MSWYFQQKLNFKNNFNDSFWHYLAVTEVFNKTLKLNYKLSNKIFEETKKTACRFEHHISEIYIPNIEGWQVFLCSLYSKYIKNQDFVTVGIIARNEEKAI